MKTKLNNLLKNKEVQSKIKDVLIALTSLVAVVISLTSCGVTKATIHRPAEGTFTTVTITTNNPISTNTNPNVNFK